MKANTNPQKKDKTPIPWLWFMLGFGLAAALLVGVWFGLQSFLLQSPAGAAANPIIIQLTAPPSPIPSLTPIRPTATPIPTFTPIPTPDVAVAPDELTIGFYAAVANTDDLGVTLRGGPSRQNIVIVVVEEGAPVLVLDGPQESGDLLWWKLRLADGTEGWAAGNFLEPIAAP